MDSGPISLSWAPTGRTSVPSRTGTKSKKLILAESSFVAEWRERSLAQVLRCAPTTLGFTLPACRLGREADCTPDRILPPGKRSRRGQKFHPRRGGDLFFSIGTPMQAHCPRRSPPWNGTGLHIRPRKVTWGNSGPDTFPCGMTRHGRRSRPHRRTWGGTGMWDGTRTRAEPEGLRPDRMLGRYRNAGPNIGSVHFDSV